MYEIAQHTNANTLGALAGVNRSTTNISKAEYDKRMPATPLQLSKEQLVNKIWYILTNIYGTEYTAATEWPEDIYEYLFIMGTFPDYNTNKGPYNALYKFNSKRGYFEFMKRLSKEKVLGLYSWMSSIFLDYWRIGTWAGGSVMSQKRMLRTMSVELQRPEARAIKDGL